MDRDYYDDEPARDRARLPRGSFLSRGQIPGIRPRGAAERDQLGDLMRVMGIPVYDRAAQQSDLSRLLRN